MERKFLLVEMDVDRRTSAAMDSSILQLDTQSGVAVDRSFPMTPIPRFATVRRTDHYRRDAIPIGTDAAMIEQRPATAVVRVVVAPDEDPVEAAERLRRTEGVVEVFADVPIEPCLICPGSPPRGTHADVERLLGTAAMRACGLTGAGVTVAIVDTGVNIPYLNSRGKQPVFDAGRSWVPRQGLTPGQMPVGHGTMCAFDVCIAAPACTLVDIAVLASNATGGSIMDGLLSDAVRAYNHLLTFFAGVGRPGQNRSLVVNNSWGMFHPSWDFARNHPGNYSHNPNHPFNRIVATLAAAGADILFAAGNCGSDCPDGRCDGVTDSIYGANSHPDVITVAGIDIDKQRVGYSTKGPGCIENKKPDICGYTHFAGSGVYSSDGGTSAATPVVAGVVAAIRTRRPWDAGMLNAYPKVIRELIKATAEDLGTAGWDYEHGAGAINAEALRQSVCKPPVKPVDICKKYPWMCKPPHYICVRYPWLCAMPPVPGPLPGPGPIPRPGPDPVPPMGFVDADPAHSGQEDVGRPLEVEEAYWLGVANGMMQAASQPPNASVPRPEPHRCGCAGKAKE